ncbi:MAG: ATP-binding protein, partial [Erysipelotrichaceae bacterium]
TNILKQSEVLAIGLENNMRKKISKSIIEVSIIVLSLTFCLILGVLYQYYTNNQIIQLKNELELVSQGINLNQEKFLDKLNIDNYRITWIAKDGVVIYDSKANNQVMDNHIEREEFIEASKVGYGQSERVSKTLSGKTYYVAKRLDDNSIIRVSINQLTIFSLVLSLVQPILIVIIIVLVLSAYISHKLSKKIIGPINNLDLQKPLDNNVYGELTPLLRKIDGQNKKIKNQLEDISNKNNEINYILENVNEGIIILNESGNVITSNKKAKQLISCEDNKYYLSNYRDLSFQRMVEKVLLGQDNSVNITIGDNIYRFNASATNLHNGNFSAIIFINDVTAEEEQLKLRRQFSSNVSHELKTPLTSIMGSAEIISNGLVKDKEVPYFANKIYEEANHLLNLIKNILKISQLDEGVGLQDLEIVKVDEIAHQVQDKLSDKCQKNNIEFVSDINQTSIKGISHVIFEIIYNLCDNAINYSKDNGVVKLEVSDIDQQVIIKVSDNGIGISKEHLPYIFERFYRVDKSHNKNSGGSGLGLSIVKNGVNFHQGTIEIQSEINKGTTITIKFPKNII